MFQCEFIFIIRSTVDHTGVVRIVIVQYIGITISEEHACSFSRRSILNLYLFVTLTVFVLNKVYVRMWTKNPPVVCWLYPKIRVTSFVNKIFSWRIIIPSSLFKAWWFMFMCHDSRQLVCRIAIGRCLLSHRFDQLQNISSHFKHNTVFSELHIYIAHAWTHRTFLYLNRYKKTFDVSGKFPNFPTKGLIKFCILNKVMYSFFQVC